MRQGADPRCRAAVCRVFNEFRRYGRPEAHAFEAALAVYRWHRPGDRIVAALAQVSMWVRQGHLN